MKLDRHGKRGMTIIEVTICSAVGAAVLGMIWLCYTQTDSVARGQIMKAHALSEATSISNTISTVLGQSLNPVDFGAEKTAGDEKFQPHRIAVYSRAGARADSPWQYVVIENKPTSDDGKARAVSASYGANVQFAGGQSDLFNSRIEFYYANEFDENTEAKIIDRLAEDQRPLFVRYRVTVLDRLGRMSRPVIINSGVALP